MWKKFPQIRLGVVLLGDRLCVAVVQQNRVDTFIVEAEEPAVALRAELDARQIAARSVALGLARDMVTVKPIALPALGGELGDMVKFELDRHLPFPAEDAPFDFLPLPAESEPGRGPAGQRRVLIAAADRRVVDAALRLADGAKLRPVSVTVAAHELLALVDAPRAQRVVWMHRAGDAADLLLVQGATLALSRSVPAGDAAQVVAEIRRSLALAALLVPGLRDGRRLAGLNAEIGRIEPEVRRVRAVLGALERKRQLLATIDGLDAGAIRPLPVLRELTEILPNEAWLTTVALDAKGVELVGQAAAASTLIPLLENSPRLERVEFASPVTRGRDREQFRIRAAWEAAPAPRARPGVVRP